MRETLTNAYNAVRTNASIYADFAKRLMQFTWHLTTTNASSAWQMGNANVSAASQFIRTHSQNAWDRVRGTQATANASAATATDSPSAPSAAQEATTASFVYTQVTRPVNWLYQRASVNLPSFLRSQPVVSPVAAVPNAETPVTQRLG